MCRFAIIKLEFVKDQGYVVPLSNLFKIKIYNLSFFAPYRTPTRPQSADVSTDMSSWNPFGDHDDFGGLTEEIIMGREFDKFRRGSNSSMPIVCFTRL